MSDTVERLLADMTLEEKLGQLNMIDAGMPPGGEDEMERQIQAGRIGSILNVHGQRLDKWQRLAIHASSPGHSAMRPQRGSRQTSSIGANVRWMPARPASSAAAVAVSSHSFGSNAPASASGIGKIV